MRLKSPIAGVLLACVGLVSTSSCVSDPILPSQSELFNREFIKNFGVYDRNHDWNHANQASVTVTTPAPTDIKIYANVKGIRYLFGTFIGVNGTSDLKVDLPKEVNSIIVRANGKDYTTSIGSKLNIGKASRVVLNPGENSGITTELCTKEEDWMVVPFLNATVFRRKMPEGTYNINREGVTTDFMFKFTEHDFIIRPLFWDTSQTLRLGMFYLDDNGDPVRFPIYHMEKTATFSDDLVLSMVQSKVKEIKISDYTSNENLLKCFKDNDVIVDELSVKDNFEEAAGTIKATALEDKNVTFACRQYLQEYVGLKNSKRNEDGSLIDEDKRFNYVYRWRFENDNKDFVITYTYFNYDTWTAPTEANTFGGSNTIENCTSYKSLVSKGIKVHVDNLDREYGFYIIAGWPSTDFGWTGEGSNIFYSLSTLNKGVRWEPKEGAVRGSDGRYNDKDFTQISSKRTPRACTWVGTKYSWRYLSFEDGSTIMDGGNYNRDSNDFDMQDIVFLIDNVDPHEVIDKEEDPYTPDIPYEWVIATEDLGTLDDFDFNDVVFGVSNPITENGKTTVTIHALAAGGTLPIYLLYNDEIIKPEGTNSGEFHSWFSGNHSSDTPINVKSIREEGIKYTLTVDENFSISCCQGVENGNMGGFKVHVVKSNGNVTEIAPPFIPENGHGEQEAPQMICVPNTWLWPTERTHILSPYPRFKDWTNNQNANHDWHENPQGSVWSRPELPQALD